jgi:hypothetical protein
MSNPDALIAVKGGLVVALLCSLVGLFVGYSPTQDWHRPPQAWEVRDHPPELEVAVAAHWSPGTALLGWFVGGVVGLLVGLLFGWFGACVGGSRGRIMGLLLCGGVCGAAAGFSLAKWAAPEISYTHALPLPGHLGSPSGDGSGGPDPVAALVLLVSGAALGVLATRGIIVNTAQPTEAAAKRRVPLAG